MAEVQIDHGISGAAGSEEGGIVNGFTRIAQVTEIWTDGEPYGSAVAVFKVYDALDEAGFAYGDILEFEGVNYPNLTVSRRAVEMTDVDKAKVTLTYSFMGTAGGGAPEQDLDSPEHGRVFYKHRAALEQITTNRYPSWFVGDESDGDRRRAEEPLELEHTFPDGSDSYLDPDGVAFPADKDFPGQTFYQGGEISIFVVRRYVTVDGLMDAEAPNNAVAILGYVNQSTWMSGGPRTWLCTAFDYEVHDATVDSFKYKVHMEFEYHEEGWDPTAVFLDKRTGKPPLGLEEDAGYITLEYYRWVDFFDILELTE